MFGLSSEALSGRSLASLLVESGPTSVLPSQGGDTCAEVERQYARPDGTTATFHMTETWVRDASGAIQFGTTIIEDVTAKKQLEGSLRHAQKLESVGRLASGIAHELNTPIQFVNDNVHFLETSFEAVMTLIGALKGAIDERAPELTSEASAAEEEADWEYLGVEVPKSISQTLDGLKRVATIVQSMKNFAHNDRGEQGLTDLNAALASTLIVASHELKGVATATEAFGDIPPVLCSRGDLSQVFLNLIVNAAHSIGDVVKATGEQGQITVATRREGDDVIVSISDTGGGIPKEIRGRLFEPFFTTKEVGRGSGQGLALARSIVVQKHGGALTFDTEEGVGTTFHIRLPIAGVVRDARAA
jgi:signal transduction histidine kinase